MTGDGRVDGFKESFSDATVRQNTLKFSVYYQSLNYRAIQEEAAYVLVDMLADLGGAVDLWVGMSVLAMCQCLEWLLLIGAYVCCSAPQHKNRNMTDVKRIKPNPQSADIYGRQSRQYAQPVYK